MNHVWWLLALAWGGVACGGSTTEGSVARANVAGSPNIAGDGVSGGGAAAGDGVSGGRAAAGDAGSGDVTQPAATWSQPWNVVMHIADKASRAAVLCDGMSFTLDFPSPNGVDLAIASRDGQAEDLGLQRQPDGSLLEAYNPVFLSLSSACQSVSFEISGMSLRATNGALTGTAQAVAQYALQGDIAFASDDVDVSFTGTTDATAPTLLLPGAALNPTDRLLIETSEALASASVSLTNNSGSLPLPLTDVGADGPPVSMSLGTDQVLPFSGSWQLTGTGLDFAGNPLLLGQTISTVADPGVFAQDGFEGTLHALQPDTLSQITDDSFVVKPITGSHSLLINAGGAVTLHLLRSAGQSTLVFNVVDLIPANKAPGVSDPQFGGYAAVIGGKERAALSWVVTGENAISDNTWRAASNPTLVQVPLTDAGSDVVIAFTAPAANYGPYGIGGPLYQTDSLLIDDVHLQ